MLLDVATEMRDPPGVWPKVEPNQLVEYSLKHPRKNLAPISLMPYGQNIIPR